VASAAAIRARLRAVASPSTISIAGAIGTPTIPKSAPNTRTPTITVEPDTWVNLPDDGRLQDVVLDLLVDDDHDDIDATAHINWAAAAGAYPQT